MKNFTIIVFAVALSWFGFAPAHAAGLELRMPVDGQVTRAFEAPATRYGKGHRGVDIDAPAGTVVRAAAQGRVYFTGQVAGRPSVSVDHGNGLRTTYTPVVGTLRKGDVVTAGQPIGTLAAGHCERACLHWGLTDGETYHDPLPHLAKRQVRLVPLGTRPVTPPTLPAATTASLGTPGTKPVAGPVTSRFGMRLHPVTGVFKLHDGTDFGASCGTPIHLPWEGTVTRTERTRGYGLRVIVEHPGGLQTAYAHLDRFDVRVGQRIPAGGQVGRVGNTGYSTGCHLHWMAWRGGRLVDPLTLVR
ncbi:peptidoglycan DD-metalloendopeptidase family protein [uncultured Tessaracoccus sp.]|uniref:peptidoglycan DD-metalloendopeptidase family protein n=1 Tax=uncultured Tessaracoccus sp. TaxID=905023 RepID=UPI0025FBD62C|nr:peptidoglycan DD-metalloendopeptidase family protein [uncultured Tessaracoccus sp.]